MLSAGRMAGHVFIVHGDITQLMCDAWLLPGGPSAVPGNTWMESVGHAPMEKLPQGWPTKNDRVTRWTKLHARDPEPFFADVGGSYKTPISWYVDAAIQFLERASAFVKD